MLLPFAALMTPAWAVAANDPTPQQIAELDAEFAKMRREKPAE
jgi:hypothetical protein